MSAQQIFRQGFWTGSNRHNQIPDFSVRKFPCNMDNINVDFLNAYTGEHYLQGIKNYEFVKSDCSEKFVMEYSDHTMGGHPSGEKESFVQKYLDTFINNPNAMLILSNVTEPADTFIWEMLRYICLNMDHKSLKHRLIIVVPDSGIKFLLKEYLHNDLNCTEDLFITIYAGHLVAYEDLKNCDHNTQTVYPEPLRVSCLNGQHKSFRLYICYKLWQAGLIDKMQITYWNKTGYGNPRELSNHELIADIQVVERKSTGSEYIDPKFNEFLDTLPLKGGAEDIEYHTTPNGKFFPWCLNESPIHIIPETLFDRPTFKHNEYPDYNAFAESVFITEKIYRAMLTGRAFLPMAQIGMLDKLHSMGFKTFDRWWPERELERLTNDYAGHGERFNSLVKIVGDIYNMTDLDFSKMIAEMKPTLDYNREVMLELVANQDRNRKQVYSKVHNWLNT